MATTIGADHHVRVLKDLTSGTIAGMATVLVGHPFNTNKARLQLQPTPPIYSGMGDCVRQTIRNEGWKGLYKGMASPFTGIGIVNAVAFYSNEEAKRVLQNYWDPVLSTASLTFAGAVAGAASAIVSSPVELVMLRLQTQVLASKSVYAGPIDCFQQVVRNEGAFAMYKGLGVTLQRDFWSMGAYFGIYATFRQHLISSCPQEVEPHSLQAVARTFVAGGTAGMVAQLISLPFDAVKVRLQTQGTHQSAFSCTNQLFKAEGCRGFFRGLGPVILRAFPANGAAFVAFELCLRLFDA